MLSYNERGIRKLQENFACFHDKLAEEDVFHSFLTVVGKTKKFAKPEIKVMFSISRYTTLQMTSSFILMVDIVA